MVSSTKTKNSTKSDNLYPRLLEHHLYDVVFLQASEGSKLTVVYSTCPQYILGMILNFTDYSKGYKPYKGTITLTSDPY